ncbi:hypothetical protein [Pinirhizobacter soli]|uniref:hypothetical protein n=1 Tax=Pinirhizobacter soli TaxID=2786953 RepID=UPI00202A4E2A|nr:hypothetical protein [Pinirhizobacter soli]
MQQQGLPVPDQVEHHRLVLEQRHGAGLAVIDAPTRALLHQMRWRQAPRERLPVVLGVALVVFLHLVIFIAARLGMQPHAPEALQNPRDSALQVRLIDRPPPLTAEVEPPPPPEIPVPRNTPPRTAAEHRAPPPPQPAPPREAPAPGAMQATLGPPAPRLFDNGQVKLAPAPASTARTPDFVAQRPQGDDKVMKHDQPLKYTETRFDADWTPVRENILQEGLRKTLEAVTVKKTFDLGNGARVNCGFAIIFLSCGGDPPPPPPKKDGDKRLNMPPANPLVPGMNPPPPMDIKECIEVYRKGQPLPQACPTDTPLRSMDAEKKRLQGNDTPS